MPIEEAVETPTAFQAPNFPLKSYYFLLAAPPLTVHHAAAFLHPKDVQKSLRGYSKTQPCFTPSQ